MKNSEEGACVRSDRFSLLNERNPEISIWLRWIFSVSSNLRVVMRTIHFVIHLMMCPRHLELLLNLANYTQNLFVKVKSFMFVKSTKNSFFVITYVKKTLMKQSEILSFIVFFCNLVSDTSHQGNKLIYGVVHWITCHYFKAVRGSGVVLRIFAFPTAGV